MYLFFGYIFGAIFSQYIFFDLSLTVWTNLWVYGWILLWPFFLFVKFIFWFAILFFTACIIYLIVVNFTKKKNENTRKKTIQKIRDDLKM